ncbi:MAG: GTPase HflX [Firmicutes bacterium]|nr:GTPase HflX [Bacillota bacterium]MBR6473133.1 GTPase HflX [Bacillota bacterium]
MLRFNDSNEVIREETYKAILVGLKLDEDISYSMEELKGLCEADSIEVIGNVIQSLEKPNTATLIGKGKVEELTELISNMDADLVVFNDELSGMQLRNLEDALDVKVIDRVILILDIFAKRASTREGKLQVELAQLKYRLPRLTGFGKSLSRLGGGIGTRGPGETKLETDRRHIERRVDDIREELASIRKTRSTQKKRREKNEIPVVALVGYTNSGKSALMNRILSKVDKEEKQVYEENMLFATLDTYQRRVDLDKNHSFILVDTIGFVSRLPHLLIEAFKATLEIVSEADLLVHVVDSSYENHDFQISVTEKVLKEIDAGAKDKIMAFNKIDLVGNRDELIPVSGVRNHYISAKYDYGVDELIEDIKKEIFKDFIRTEMLIPYDRGDAASFIQSRGTVFGLEYREDGTYIDCELKIQDYNKYREFELK